MNVFVNFHMIVLMVMFMVMLPVVIIVMMVTSDFETWTHIAR